MTLDAKKLSYHTYLLPDDAIISKEEAMKQPITPVIGVWADFIRTDFETGDVTVPDGNGGWKYLCHILDL